MPARWPTLAAVVLSAALAGCAIQTRADRDEVSDASVAIVSGHMNYVIDGRVATPYGHGKGRWPAPFMNVVNLSTGRMHALPAVDDETGAFRWRIPPGAYLATRIGHGTFVDDTYIAWPQVAVCVPSVPGRVVALGHLRLEGTRYEEPRQLSTGTRYVARGVRYRLVVVDDAPAAPHEVPSPMRVDPSLPAGDGLQARFDADRVTLAREVCPGLAP